eukprot:Hpha_TRINITY_DN16953_c5_g5::TRINITY_DN16953_c5_g5_i1::g.52646::m.52646
MEDGNGSPLLPKGSDVEMKGADEEQKTETPIMEWDVSHWKRHSDVLKLTNTDWKDKDCWGRLTYCKTWYLPFFLAVLPFAFELWEGAKPPADVTINSCNITKVDNATLLDEVAGVLGIGSGDIGSAPVSLCAFCNNGSTTVDPDLFLGIVSYAGSSADSAVYYLVLVLTLIEVVLLVRLASTDVYFKYRLMEHGVCVEPASKCKILMSCKSEKVILLWAFAVLIMLLPGFIAAFTGTPIQKGFECEKAGVTVVAKTAASSQYECDHDEERSCYSWGVLTDNFTYFAFLYPVLVTLFFLFFSPYQTIDFTTFVVHPTLLASLQKSLKYKVDQMNDDYRGAVNKFERMLKDQNYKESAVYQDWKAKAGYLESEMLLMVPYYCQHLSEADLLEDLLPKELAEGDSAPDPAGLGLAT